MFRIQYSCHIFSFFFALAEQDDDDFCKWDFPSENYFIVETYHESPCTFSAHIHIQHGHEQKYKGRKNPRERERGSTIVWILMRQRNSDESSFVSVLFSSIPTVAFFGRSKYVANYDRSLKFGWFTTPEKKQQLVILNLKHPLECFMLLVFEHRCRTEFLITFFFHSFCHCDFGALPYGERNSKINHETHLHLRDDNLLTENEPTHKRNVSTKIRKHQCRSLMWYHIGFAGYWLLVTSCIANWKLKCTHRKFAFCSWCKWNYMTGLSMTRFSVLNFHICIAFSLVRFLFSFFFVRSCTFSSLHYHAIVCHIGDIMSWF